jgi:hemoglobin/transferrin/lactoferrin receptor protein
LLVQAALENIFDTHYRVFASGISSPGRSIRLTLRASF